MADAKPSMTDGWVTRFQKYITQSVSTFAATIFLIFTLGAVFGHLFGSSNPNFILVPAILGVLAYYNRSFAIIGLAIFAFIILL